MEGEMHKCFSAVVLSVVAVGVMAVPVGAKSKPPPSTEQLQAKLLQLSDMPTGWAGAATDPATQTGSACGGPNLAGVAQNAGATGTAATTFVEDPTMGPSFTESVYSFPSAQVAKGVMAHERKLVKTCPTWDASSNGTTTYTYMITELSARKLGNDTVGVRLTASPKGETGTVSGRADVILIRVKGVVVASSVVGLTLAGFNLGKYAKLGLTRLDPLL
jgi:hypothetical protein